MKVLVASVGLPHTVTGQFVPFPSSIADAQKVADNTRKWYLENSYGKLAPDFTVVPQVINIDNNIYVGAYAARAALGFKQSD